MKCYQQLSQEQRYTITEGTISHLSKAEIARRLGRSPSTIGRELARNRRASDGRYRADEANGKANARRREARRGFRHTEEQWVVVIRLIAEKWSPEQISGILKVHGPFTISHETIYKRILLNKQEGGELYKYLRIMPKARRKRYNSRDSARKAAYLNPSCCGGDPKAAGTLGRRYGDRQRPPSLHSHPCREEIRFCNH